MYFRFWKVHINTVSQTDLFPHSTPQPTNCSVPTVFAVSSLLRGAAYTTLTETNTIAQSQTDPSRIIRQTIWDVTRHAGSRNGTPNVDKRIHR